MGCRTISERGTPAPSPGSTAWAEDVQHEPCPGLRHPPELLEVATRHDEHTTVAAHPSSDLWQQMMSLSNEDYTAMVLAMNRTRSNLSDELGPGHDSELSWCLDMSLRTILTDRRTSEVHRLLSELVTKLNSLLEKERPISPAGNLRELLRECADVLLPIGNGSLSRTLRQNWIAQATSWILLIKKVNLGDSNATSLISIYLQAQPLLIGRSRSITLRFRVSHGHVEFPSNLALLRTINAYPRTGPIFTAVLEEDFKEMERLLSAGEATVSDRDIEGSLPIAVSLTEPPINSQT